MSRFAQYTIANAPESSKPLLARVHKALGFVPNLFATFAESPAVLEGYLALSGSLDKGALSPTERQLVEIAVDRKSTRLNSSHLVISYAGFCLKKKAAAVLAFAPAFLVHLVFAERLRDVVSATAAA